MRFLWIVLCCGLWGCLTDGEPSVELVEVSAQRLGKGGLSLDVTFELDNPFNVAVQLVEVEYELRAFDQPLVHGFRLMQEELEAYGRVPFHLDVVIENLEEESEGFSPTEYESHADMPVTVRTTFKIETPTGRVEVGSEDDVTIENPFFTP